MFRSLGDNPFINGIFKNVLGCSRGSTLSTTLNEGNEPSAIGCEVSKNLFMKRNGQSLLRSILMTSSSCSLYGEGSEKALETFLQHLNNVVLVGYRVTGVVINVSKRSRRFPIPRHRQTAFIASTYSQFQEIDGVPVLHLHCKPDIWVENIEFIQNTSRVR